MLTDDAVSFEQRGPGASDKVVQIKRSYRINLWMIMHIYPYKNVVPPHLKSSWRHV